MTMHPWQRNEKRREKVDGQWAARYGEFPTFPCLRAILQKIEREANPLFLFCCCYLYWMIGLVCF